MEFDALPELCIAKILSNMTPVDVCRLSLVSRTFYSAAQSDIVWNNFLPSDLMSVISRSVTESYKLAKSPFKRSLYLALSHHPIIIDHATKSFQLDRKSGKSCYMLAATTLNIVWGHHRRHWEWITLPVTRKDESWKWETLPECRFPKVARLADVRWLEISGVININALSPNTHYAAYLVFAMINGYGFHRRPVELSLDMLGGQSSTKNVCIDPDLEERQLHKSVQGLQRPNVRGDGWLEFEIGEFFNAGLRDDEVRMSIRETKDTYWKRGLFIHGIEVRPKEGY